MWRERLHEIIFEADTRAGRAFDIALMASIAIESEVIGTVWRIEKSVGDRVEQDELVMILESMKMEIPVEASAAGTLASLEVAEGDSVDEGQVLCRIET